mmetsp:Transcript_13234/g.15457  ORF Transcript_13234/g.15457 Transcript_13234/m.15457 type:complete len:185 (-) Transcript_13234:80-634(-)
MALNIPLEQSSNIPLAIVGETFLVLRKDVECEITVSGMKKLKATGSVYLTTERLAFVSSNPTVKDGFAFYSFGLPLNTLRKESFNQPIFGCNNLSGTVSPYPGSALPSSIDFKLFFKNGCGRFLSLFFLALRGARNPSAIPEENTLSSIAQRGQLDQVAAVDLNDPSVLYISQPDSVGSGSTAL